MCEGCGCDTPKERPVREAKEAGHWHVHADGTVHRHADDTAHHRHAEGTGAHHHADDAAHHHHADGPMDRRHRDEDIEPRQPGPQEKP